MLSAHAASVPGRARKTNEDAFLVDVSLGAFVVADGMGGQRAGEVASRLAIEAIGGFLSRSAGGEDFTWPYGIDTALSFQGNRLMTAVRLANRRIVKAGDSRDDYAGLGTTVVAALMGDEEVSFTSVGDSRLYSYAGGRLTQLTEDDSWAATVRARDAAAPAGASMRHVLTNVVGAREPLEMDVHEQRVPAEATWLLCSDGLHSALDEAAIAAALASPASVETIADGLVAEAVRRDGEDDVTALVVRLGKAAAA